MNTRDEIKKQALSLFNQDGLMNVTLRHVAEHLHKSYGNITYHFANKELLIKELYEEMVEELRQITLATSQNLTLKEVIFELPERTFELSNKYLFFYVDYIELRRNYPEFMEVVDLNNMERARSLKYLLMKLRDDEFLKPEIDDETLDHIMELSGAIRTFFFQRYYLGNATKAMYIEYTNRLLLPYLSNYGAQAYQNYLNATSNWNSLKS
ncbi:MAG: TetR/AcrR family transcriptional regulator [Saprospiraceae bacterium]